MIDWDVVNFILREIQNLDNPKFDDPDEQISWLIYETWKLAKQNNQG